MKTEEEKRKAMDVSKGILFAFISGAMLSCATVIVKYLRNIHPGQLVFYRFWANSALSLPAAVWSGENILGPPGYRTYVALRAVLTSVSIFFQFLAFRYLPVGEAAVLLSTSPVFVTIAAKFFLKEDFGFLQTISLLTTVIGIILITGLHQTLSDNPRIYNTEDIYGFSAGLVAALCSTGTFILTRKCNHICSSVLLFNAAFVGMVGSAITMSVIGSFSLLYRGLQQVLVIVLGIVSCNAIMALIVSLKFLTAGPAATMRCSSDILFSFFWQVFFFSDVPNTETIIGALLISISIFLLGFRNRIKGILHGVYLKACRSFSQ